MKFSIEGNNELVIRIPLNTAGNLSKSGKSQNIDTTNGFTSMATPFGTVKIGLNVITTDADWTGGKAKPVPQVVKAA
jgi:hypothetical protein